jgi:hypothetical protein
MYSASPHRTIMPFSKFNEAAINSIQNCTSRDGTVDALRTVLKNYDIHELINIMCVYGNEKKIRDVLETDIIDKFISLNCTVINNVRLPEVNPAAVSQFVPNANGTSLFNDITPNKSISIFPVSQSS